MKFPLLALLARRPAYGYELGRALGALFGDPLPPVNEGQIYTTLSRLEREGLVHARSATVDGRRRKVYEPTAAGRDALAGWLAEADVTPPMRDDFFWKLVLAGLAGLSDPQELIERRRRALLQSVRGLDEAAAALAGAAREPAALLVEGALLHLEADLKWLDLCEQRLPRRCDRAQPDRGAGAHEDVRDRRARDPGAARRRSDDRRGGVRRRDGPERMREDDPAQRDRRPRSAD